MLIRYPTPMPARTKGRAKFDFRGRPFVWWVDGDYWLRVSSLDKKFVVAYALGLVADSPPVVAVSGAEFPGIDRRERRPVWLVAPELSAGSGGSLGPWVEQLLSWSFDPDRQITRTGPPRFAGVG